MKKNLLSVLALTTVIFGTSFAGTVNAEQPEVKYAPPQETLINGVEESKLIAPLAIGYDNPIFVDFKPSTGARTINAFKPIASVSHNNTRASDKFPISMNVTSSSSVGSEFSGSLTFTGELEIKLIAKAGAELSGSYKKTRTTNEAVGYNWGPYYIPAGKWGGIRTFWRGVSIDGTASVKYVDTGSSTGYTSVRSVPISMKVHETKQDIYSEAWDATYQMY